MSSTIGAYHPAGAAQDHGLPPPALSLAVEKTLRATEPLPTRKVDRSVPVDLVRGSHQNKHVAKPPEKRRVAVDIDAMRPSHLSF